jgi:hypothetical protein
VNYVDILFPTSSVCLLVAAGLKAKGWLGTATVLPFLAIYSTLLFLLYLFWFQEILIIWYGANESNILAQSLYFLELLVALIPLAGWIQKIRLRAVVYFRLLLISQVGTFFTAHLSSVFMSNT